METPPVILPREITYEWSRELSKASMRRFLWRQHRAFLIIFSIFAAASIGCLAFDHRKELAGKYWGSLAISLVPVLLFVKAYFGTAKIFENLPDNHVTVRIEPEGITFKTSESVSIWKWSAIKRLWKFSDVWLVFRYKQSMSYSVLPTAELGADLTKFIEDKVKQHGGLVA
jgi:hypothetical protein